MSTIWLVSSGNDVPNTGPAVVETLSPRPLRAVYATTDEISRQWAALLTSVFPLASTPWEPNIAHLHALSACHPQGEVVMIAPVDTVRALLGELLGLPADGARRIHQQVGALNRIIIEPHRIVVAGINDVCHLDA